MNFLYGSAIQLAYDEPFKMTRHSKTMDRLHGPCVASFLNDFYHPLSGPCDCLSIFALASSVA